MRSRRVLLTFTNIHIMTQPAGRVYMCAPINAIVEGLYEERIPFTEIKRHGDFGLGTFDHLDGEMVMLDGKIFQITADGFSSEVEDTALTPFSCVTFFTPESEDSLEREMSNDAFDAWLRALLPSPNIIYALRIEGEFAEVKARSVPKQECYRPLVDVTRHQHVFEFNDVKGTLAGFYTPAFMGSLSVPGLHLHFLSDDLKRGGHVLGCRPRNVRVQLQFIYTVELALPSSLDYLTADFQRDVKRDLDKAER
jgi:acetolactate decarboxylase